MKVYTILLSMLFAVGCSVDLHKNLFYYETLNIEDLDVTTRGKRNADGRFLYSKHVRFTTLGKNFSLILYPGSPVLGPNFKAKTVDANGKTELFHVNQNDFFTGHLEDDTSVNVDAHFEDGILSSFIRFPNDTYVVEPSWRHRQPWEKHTMISYRGSDVNWEEIFPIDPKTGKRTKMRGGVRVDSESVQSNRNEHNINTTGSSGVFQKHLNLRLLDRIPDTEVWSFISISSIQFVNGLFKRTVWDSDRGFTNLGFQIDELLIHTNFTVNSFGDYNDDLDWGYNQKLNAFSRLRRVVKFCLGHLYTSFAFKDSVLGLAFIASDRSAIGGICSPDLKINEFKNVGWSSAKNSRNDPLLSLQFHLVSTHEFGHSWGAEHDADTDECSPSSSDGGKYVMYTYAVQGYSENNKYFSPCSKRFIAAVLRQRIFNCFRDEADKKSFCGNAIIEDGEQCDVGILEDYENDRCCDQKCRLKEGANCSSFNHPCCKNCLIAPKGVLCEERNNLTCKDQSFCNGTSLDCPEPGKLSDQTKCIDRGLCYQGECLNYCSVLGRRAQKVMHPCFCMQNVSAMCQRCCFEVVADKKGDCLPTNVSLPAGRTCPFGTCDDNGRCVKVEQQIAIRIFSFIKHLSVDKIVVLMRSNIVGTVLILSLMIWIPASYIVSAVDRKKEREFLEMRRKQKASAVTTPKDQTSLRPAQPKFTNVPQFSEMDGNVDGFNFSATRKQNPKGPKGVLKPSALKSVREMDERQTISNIQRMPQRREERQPIQRKQKEYQRQEFRSRY